MSEQREADIPDFISVDLCEKALQSAYNSSSIKIDRINLTWGSAKGDNYCSEIYRAECVYNTNKKISLIIKSMPVTPARQSVLELDVFNKEVGMYMDTIPKISAICNGEVFSARCFYATTEPCHIIIFQDLSPLGFKMVDRNKGLDIEHSTLVMKKLGQFHGATIILGEQDPTIFDKYPTGIILGESSPINNVYKRLFNDGLEIIVKYVAPEWKGYEDIVRKLKHLTPDFIKRVQKHIYRTATSVKVINHGDLWVNNIMFKYGIDKRPIGCVFIDYQMCYASSCGIDLNYFAATSLTSELRENSPEDILRTYHNSLVVTLQNHKVNWIPTLDHIKNEFNTRQFYGLATAIGFLPLMIADKDKAKDMSLDALLISDEDEVLKQDIAKYKYPIYQQTLKVLLKQFYDVGALDNTYDDN